MTPERKTAIAWQCQQLALRFIAASDRQDWEAMCGLLTEDAIFARPTDPDNALHGREAIRAAFESRPADRVTRHFCTNHVVTVRSPTEASGTLYALLYTGDAASRASQGFVADGRQLVGEFDDEYLLTDAGWRLASRRGRIVFATA